MAEWIGFCSISPERSFYFRFSFGRHNAGSSNALPHVPRNEGHLPKGTLGVHGTADENQAPLVLLNDVVGP